MKNHDSKKPREDRKALPKFLLLLLCGMIIGGVISVLCNIWTSGSDLGQITAMLAELSRGFSLYAAPWLMAAMVVLELAVGTILYQRAKGMIKCWDGEDETVSERAERLLSIGIWLGSTSFIIYLFLIVASYSVGPEFFKSDWSVAVTIVGFVVGMVTTVILQQKIMGLIQKLNPERKLPPIYDTEFQKKMNGVLDEAELARAGQCALKAYRAVNNLCATLCFVLAVTGLFLGTGILPVLMVCLIRGTATTVYVWAALQLDKGK